MGASSVKRDCPLITRKFAERWFSQKFLDKVKNEIERANESARFVVKDRRHPLVIKPRKRGDRGGRPRDSWQERLLYDANNPNVIAVARYVKDGKTRSEISEIMGLQEKTIAKYASIARTTGSLDKGLYLKP